MNAQGPDPTARKSLVRLAVLSFLAVLLAGSQSGCCCFECIEHCVAPLHYLPPRSALTPRNPPCGYVDPLCYGYHATCWHSWPAECDGRDCLEWYQHDALPLPAKGDMSPSLAPMPMPEQPQAPAPEPPATQPQPEREDSSALPVEPQTEQVTLAPVIRAIDVPFPTQLENSESAPPHSSRRLYEHRASAELP